MTIAMPPFPSMATASFTQLAAATSYTVTASCRLANGDSTLASDPVAFKTFGGSYNRPPPGADTQCDGRGETVNEEGQCVCDAYNIVDGPFKANGEGGCECFDDAEDLGYGPCICAEGSVNCYEGCCTVCSPQNFILSASNALSDGEDFGQDVALNAVGDVLVVGDFDADYNGKTKAGLAYVLRYDGSDWTEEEILNSGADARSNEEFGTSVAINSVGDMIAVGDPRGDAGSDDNNGRVYLFNKDGSSWTAGDILLPTAKKIARSDEFGDAVAVNAYGNVTVVSDTNFLVFDESGDYTDAGGVHVYVNDGYKWNLVQNIEASLSLNGKEFGVSLAINALGDVIAVGDEDGYDSGSGDSSGLVQIFRFNGTSWSLEDTLFGKGVEYSFGRSVALNNVGDVLVVGDPDANVTDYATAGSVYVYRYNSGSWSEEETLDAGPGVDERTDFGEDVAVNGDGTVIAVGDPNAGSQSYGEGYVYIFKKTDTWNLVANLTGSQTVADGRDFGLSVALNEAGDKLVVGDQEEPAAYLFRDDAGWTQEARFGAPPGTATFGRRVAINAVGDLIAVGDDMAPVDDGDEEGKVYIYQNYFFWGLLQTLNASDTASTGDQFGRALAMDASGEVLVVGDWDASVYDTDFIGKAYIFRYDSSEFVEETILLPPALDINALSFGNAVAMNGDGNVILVGDDPANFNGISKSGLAYVFMREGSTWVDHILSAGEDIVQYSYFGSSVALNEAGTVAVVGAPDADGAQEDDGKVYVFRYNGSSWYQSDALTSCFGTGGNCEFGTSVALNAEGDVLVVGDTYSDDDGVGGAYVYRYDGSSWEQEQFLSEGGDYLYVDFGSSVAINAAGDVIVVGDEDESITNDTPGNAYKFKYDGSSWTLDEVLGPQDSRAYYYARSVAINSVGNVVAVGDYDGSVDVDDSTGRVHVFHTC